MELPADPLAGRELAAFVAAVESASMHGAADALGLTQSAVSKRIQALERRTGVALLERGRQGVAPTEAGRLLYPEAKNALAALARAAAAVGEATDVHRLRVAASYTIGEFLLPAWLASFRAADGDASLRAEVDVINSPSVLARVRAGTAAIGFVEGVDPLDGLEAIGLLRDELVVVVAPGHRWARRRSLRPGELSREPYFTRERDSGTRAVVTAALGRHGVRLDPALETASTQVLKRAVLDGGFTVLSRVTVDGEARAGTLRALPVKGVGLERELRAVRRGRPARGAAAQRLWAWLRER